MDDVIYILLAVAWVAFSLYNANQKKKRRLAQEAFPTKPQPQASPRPRSIIEEILMGEETPSYEPEKEFEEIEPELVPEYKAAIKYQQEVQARVMKTQKDEIERIDTQDSVFEKEFGTYHQYAPSDIIKTFNLRQAVIYSIVLERPYQ